MQKLTLKNTLLAAALAALTFSALPSTSKAQGTDKSLIRIETPKFSKIHFDDNYVYIPMNFNQAEATKDIEHIDVKQIISVSLVYSQYKASARFDQLALNDSRTMELFKLIPGLKNNKNINWYWVAQTGCNSPEECSDYFHGFEIRVASKDELKKTAFESAELDYYTNIHLDKAKLEKHIDESAHTYVKEKVKVCDTTYVDYGEIKNKTGRIKPKHKRSRKNFIKMANRKLEENVNELEIYFSDRNKLDSIEGMTKPQAYKIYKQLKRDFKVSSSRLGRKRYATHFTIQLNRNTRGKVKNYSIYAEALDQQGNLLEMPAYTADYRRKITCYQIDSNVAYENPTYVTYDDVVTQVLDRNTDWKNCLVATDVTGSMYAYLGQFLAWHKLNLNGRGQNFDFVFFNDGDNMRDDWKRTGRVGGVYYVHTNEYEEIRKHCQKAQRRGGGGDGPENNIEGVIKGLKENPNVSEIIMIADNWATPRDLAILKKVKKTIHVILCGANNGINQEYLNLALENGGTVHTMEDDLTELAKVNEGESITIDGFTYTIRKGKFVRESTAVYTAAD